MSKQSPRKDKAISPLQAVDMPNSGPQSKSSSFQISNRRSSNGEGQFAGDFVQVLESPPVIVEPGNISKSFGANTQLTTLFQRQTEGSAGGHYNVARGNQGSDKYLHQSNSDIGLMGGGSPLRTYDRPNRVYQQKIGSIQGDKDSLISSQVEEIEGLSRLQRQAVPEMQIPPPPAESIKKSQYDIPSASSYSDRLNQLNQSHYESQISIEELAQQVAKQRGEPEYVRVEVPRQLTRQTNQDHHGQEQIRSNTYSRLSESNKSSRLNSITGDSSALHQQRIESKEVTKVQAAKSPTQLQLTNEYNERSMIQVFKQGLQEQIQQKMQDLLLEGTIQKKQIERSLKKQKHKHEEENTDRKSTFHYPTYPGTTTETLTTSHSGVIVDFFQHFEIEKMISMKCIVVGCFKLRNQKFMLKQLPEQATQIQEFMSQKLEGVSFNPERKLNQDFQIDFLKLIDSWVNLPPQIPEQNFSQCFGLVRIKENYYMISHLVEDYSIIKSKKKGSDLNVSKITGNKISSPIESGFFEGGGIEEQFKLAKNTYELIYSFKLGNLSGLLTIPDFYVLCLLRYIINVSDALAHSHEYNLVHGNFNLSKVVAQKFQTKIDQIVVEAREFQNLTPEKLQQMFSQFNFIIVNYEPWNVEKLMGKHLSSQSQFANILKQDNFKVQREDFLQMAKIMDLQAFGNSIIEILVGKCQEQQDITDTDRKQFTFLNKKKLDQGEIQIIDNLDLQALNITTHAKQRMSMGSIDSTKLKEELQTSKQRSLNPSQNVTRLGESQSQLKQFFGGIPLDSIPLNWAKKPQIQKILSMIKLCHGPYDFNNNFKSLNTTEIFREVNKIAREEFDLFSGEPKGPDNIRVIDQSKKLKKVRITEEEQLRLKSAVDNNQGIMMFLSISDDTHKEQRDTIIGFARQKFEQSLLKHPSNSSAMLNKALIGWQVGQVRDEQFYHFLKHDLSKFDNEAAHLMFLLFKKRIYWGKIDSQEVFPAIQKVEQNWDKVSNLAKYLYASSEFHEYRQRQKLMSDYTNPNTQMDMLGSHVGLMKTHNLQSSDKLKYVYKQTTEPTQNHRIELQDKQFDPKGIFISNNDSFVGIIGRNTIMLLDSRTGKQICKQYLPSWDQLEKKKDNTFDSDSYDDPSSMNRYSSQTQSKDDKHLGSSQDIYTETSAMVTDQQRGIQNVGDSQSRADHISIQEGDGDAPRIKSQREGHHTADTFTEGGEENNDMNKDSSTVIGVGQPNPNSGQTTQIQSQVSMLNSGQGPATQAQNMENIDRILGAESTINSGMNSMVVSQLQSREDITRKDPLNSVTELQFQQQRAEKSVQQQTQILNKIDTTFGIIDEGDPNVLKASTLTSKVNDIGPIFRTSVDSSIQKSARMQDNFNHELKKNIHEMREEAAKEKETVFNQIAPQWIASVRNNGKMVALYDKSQQIRNRRYKHKLNVSEVMLIYNIIMSKSMNPSVTTLNMRKLLNDNEVLSFGFDEFNESFSTICIQAKDLYMYEVDYVNQHLVKKIDASRTNVIMKSIFYNPFTKDKHISMYQPLTEILQQHEHLGNQVLLPKKNDQFFAIRQKDSNLIQIYSLKLRTIIRQFTLSKDEIFFEDREKEHDEIFENLLKSKNDSLMINQSLLKRHTDETASKMQRKKLRNEMYKPGLFLQGYKYSDRIPNYENYLEERNTERVRENITQKMRENLLQMRKDVHQQMMEDNRIQNEIKHIEISPQGRIIVAVVGQDIFIRILNLQIQTTAELINKKNSLQMMHSFLPVYFDLDYHQKNKEVALEQYDAKEVKLKQLKSQSQLKESMAIFEDLLSNNVQCQRDMNQGYFQFLIDVPALKQKDAYLKRIDCKSVEQITKISPGTVDRICHSFKTLKKFQGSLFQKNEKLFEVNQFNNAVLQNPRLLFDCPLRLKKRNEKLKTCLQLLREIQLIDNTQIQRGQLRGLQKMITFESLNFQRSSEHIKSFNCTTVVDSFLCAVIVNRKLQVYDFVSCEVLFEFPFPSAGAYKLKQGFQTKLKQQSIMFVDSDQIIVIQDGQNSLQLINVQAQHEAYRQQNIKQKANDITIKIEKPIDENMDFFDGFGVGFDQDEEKEKQSDDSEPLNAGIVSKKSLIFDQPIEAIFFSRSTTEYGYMALIGKLKFAIYYIYDDNIGGSDYQVVWSKEYRFDKHIRGMGQIISLDFEQQCVTFVTGTQLGWICIWDLQEKRILRRLRVTNPISGQFQACNLLRNMNLEKHILSYDAISKNLILVNNQIQVKHQKYQADPLITFDNKDQSKGKKQVDPSLIQSESNKSDHPAPAVPLPDHQGTFPTGRHSDNMDEIDCTFVNVFEFRNQEEKDERGRVEQIKIDYGEQHMVLVFANMYVDVYDLKKRSSPKLIYNIGPLDGTQIYVDEFCTYMSILGESRKRIDYYLFQWEYQCEKMKKPANQFGQSSLMRMATNDRAIYIAKMKAIEKKKTGKHVDGQAKPNFLSRLSMNLGLRKQEKSNFPDIGSPLNVERDENIDEVLRDLQEEEKIALDPEQPNQCSKVCSIF